MSSAPRSRRVAAASTAGLVLGGVPYFLVLLNFRADVLRTAVTQQFASNFFDLQATAFLDRRLTVPAGSLGIEGFVIDGQTYMYFPPFPALLRIPVQLLTHELDGRLTLPSMALSWVVLAVMTTKLVWRVRSCLRPDEDVTRTQAVAAAVLLAMATGGTVLTFDAALPWVYHEVYLWATALAMGCAYWLLRVALDPTRQAILWLGGFTLATALTRTPGGWAMSGAAIGLGAWILWRERRRHDRADGRRWLARPAAVMAAGLVPLGASIAYNWVKFGHPYLFPLESQVWTQVNAHRREALEVNGGTITGPQFFETSLVNYFRPDGIRFVDYFPWITLPAEPARAYGGAFLDQTYRTGSVPAFMPLLVLLALAAVPTLVRLRATGAVAALRWPALGSVLVGGGVMGYGYLANRYTSDFVPALIVLGTIGLWSVTRWRLPGARVLRPVLVVAMAGLCAFSVAAQVATGSLIAAQTHRGAELTSYLALQERLSGGPGSAVSRLVSRSDELPARGTADDLHVTGDCESLYVNTGDQYEPWNLVEQRDMLVDVTPIFVDYHPGTLRLFEQNGVETRYVSLEFDKDAPQARLVVEDKDGNFYSPWFEVARGKRIHVVAQAVPDIFQTRVRVDGNPDYDLYVPVGEWNKDWYNDLTRLTFMTGHDGGSTDHVRVSNSWGRAPALCERLLRDAGTAATG
ncbi:4-amino-4-deoxy-L-arabinose transferase [Pedococcus dokdonensis]|uniref:4-amino-4-deoxy-L-arabinose transferase n=1 Tax=Pedococcus dokdonensis TaxID=443156 RepID=A0A1H0PC52_9MICO|nr:hypothetical protein [Pedococcus dokdonensis]SDP02229.1 4-amino-4-deoxy-L-arabinose transferase [Pedococcus dokdonensis]